VTAPTPAPPVPDVVIDTDAFNEVDDQFAIAHLLLSPERVNVQAIHAAPFLNGRVASYGEGMERSYEEIQRLLELLPEATPAPVLRGATTFLDEHGATDGNPATDDLVERARAATPEQPLHVVAIGAPTNVALALRRAPDIADSLRIIWLGGHGLHWPDAREFNLRQDVSASRTVLAAPRHLTLVPCRGVAELLLTTVFELESCLVDSPLNRFLVDRVRETRGSMFAYARSLWDVAATAVLLTPQALRTTVRPRPGLTDDLTWQLDDTGAPADVVEWVDRNVVLTDLFTTLNSTG